MVITPRPRFWRVKRFKAAGDPKRFPEQLRFVKIWKPTRLVWNTSPFFYANRNQKFDPTGLTTVDISGFNPLLGKSYSEIAAASLSMHKSQGVGRLRGAARANRISNFSMVRR